MKLVVAVLAGSLGATSALAADLPARTYTKAPVMVDPGYNWSGFYIGGNIGYSWGRSNDTSTLTNGAGTTLFTTAGSSNLDGVVGGGQIGYNWQMQNWVWGLEADIQGTGERGSRDDLPGRRLLRRRLSARLVVPGAAVPVSLTSKSTGSARFAPAVGVLVTPKVLLYATGGLAYGEVNSSETIAASSFSNYRDPRWLHRRRRHRRRDRRQLDRQARISLCRSRPNHRVVRNHDPGPRRRHAHQLLQLACHRQHAAGRPELQVQ